MNRSSLSVALILLAAWLSPAEGVAQTGSDVALDPAGLWWADQGAARVELRLVDGRLQGSIVWLRSPFGLDGCPLLDRNNPEPELRARSILGLRIIEGLERDPEDDSRWSGGRVYEPNSGRTFRLRVEQLAQDRLELRGFIGFELLGQTQTWYRVPEPGNEPRCGGESTALPGAAALDLETWLRRTRASASGSSRGSEVSRVGAAAHSRGQSRDSLRPPRSRESRPAAARPSP